MKQKEVIADIDVSKGTLEIAIHPLGERWRVENTEEGIMELVKRLKEFVPTLVASTTTRETPGPLVPLSLSSAVQLSPPGRIATPKMFRDTSMPASHAVANWCCSVRAKETP